MMALEDDPASFWGPGKVSGAMLCWFQGRYIMSTFKIGSLQPKSPGSI